jgi:two-component system sensor histidine kinase QseC
MAGRSLSLRARLTTLVLLAAGLVWAGALVQTYRHARGEIDEVFDAHLAQAASLLIAQAGDELEEIDIEHAPALHRYSHKVAFQVWENGTRLRLHSANAPDQALGTAESGFSDRTIDARRWRVFSSWDASGELLIHVGEQADVRDALAGEMVEAFLMPLIVALPLLGLLVWWAVRGGMRPLDSMAEQIARRAPDRLEPLDAGGAPAELRPLLERLNSLFAQVARSLENERRFTADAAHELRTPLAAIRAQAQVALGVADENERRAVLRKVIEGCDRTARLMEQLLTLARLDAPVVPAAESVALRSLAAQTLAELAPRALARQIDIGLEDGPQATIRGNPGLLQVLLRNLVDNAIRYTPAGGRVGVSVTIAADAVRLAVSDTGPGIPEGERVRVTDRFYRIAGGDAEGSGLGLSIVARIVELHGAALTISRGLTGTGTTVEIMFPAPRP